MSSTGTPVRGAIGLLLRDGSYLIRRRPALPGSPMPGYWEFPGGKCEGEETPAETACRECFEEVGLEVRVGRLRRVVHHTYPHGCVELHFFDCTLVDPDQEPDPATGFQWVRTEDLPDYEFPGANAAILAEL